jgi:periplasmic protein TonB
MKLFLLILVNLIFINKAYSQNAYGKIFIEIEIDSDTVFTKADITGAVPGGDSTWKDSVIKKMNTSIFVMNGAKRGKYTVVVQYLVDKEGQIGDVKCLSNLGYGMESEAMRAIRKPPVWGPAPAEGGRPVRR